MKRLITILDIQKYRPASNGIPKERIEPFIEEAQVIDLQAALGDQLYQDFMSKHTNTADPMFDDYQKLLNGDEYTPPGYTSPISYPGIKPMLAYFTLARFYENNQVNVTRYGIVQKSAEFSEPVSAQVLASSISALKSMGTAHQEKVRRYIRDRSVFTLTGRKQEINSGGAKFFDV